MFNFIVLGSDARPGESIGRSDTMMIVSVDPNEETVTLLSIPRDLYVYLPGHRMDRINTANVRGGWEMVHDTIQYNFGIDLDGFVLVNFAGFKGAVDTLGGVTVRSTGFNQDECGGVWRTYQPDREYEMKGFEALCYVRVRKTSSDFDRLRRQQEMVKAIFDKLLTLQGLTRVPELYTQYRNTVQTTDIGVSDLLPLVPAAVQISGDESRIHYYDIDRDLTRPWRTPTGAAVLLPQQLAVRAMLEEAFGENSLSQGGN